MADFKFPNLEEISSRKFEEEIYESVLQEMASGVRRPGLWAKALAESEGDDLKARSLYLKLRGQSMLDETWLAAEEERTRGEREHKLLDAALYGRLSEVQDLLAFNTDPNTRNSNGATPLYVAAFNGHIEIVRLLLARGADPSIPNFAGRTPRQAAQAASRAEIAALLP